MNRWRPSKYDIEKYRKACDDYIWDCNNWYIKLLVLEEKSEQWIKKKFKNIKNFLLPSIWWFALYCNLNRDTIYEWWRKYKDFPDIINIIKCHQENLLIQWWLLWLYNSKIAILLLKRLWYKS